MQKSCPSLTLAILCFYASHSVCNVLSAKPIRLLSTEMRRPC
ncbi:hypothetical protein AWB81_00046 [Caballeronia arationis]|jgi:hypothetical protein|uniref:Uncharacterized protein n=1 Tax=Caballeronia arationis TaxID=1777142 RepID=A0A7Z7I8Y9_9BURK|nr:hypothetical protein AWB81_00046 [Caballeronia arationis]SOE80206.1 hypothetical protein SAMN05446927_3407 [Caballeronia arationis]